MKHLPMLLQKKEKIEVSSLLVLFILFLLPGFADAQETADADPELPGIQQVTAPVKIDGKVLFNVRGISSFNAGQRAAAISSRIKEASKDPSVSPDSVFILSTEEYNVVMAGDKFIMNVYDADANVEEIKRETLSGIIRQATIAAIKGYRDDRLPAVLMKKAIYALGSILVFALILTLLIFSFRRIDRWFQRKMKTSVDSLQNISFSLIQADRLWRLYHLLIRAIRIVLVILLVASALNYILGLFPWTRSVTAFMLKILIDPLISIGKGLVNFLPDLAFLIIIFLVTRYLLKLGKLLFKGIQQGGIEIKGFDPDWSIPTFRILRILIIAFAVIVAYPYIPGSGSSAFKGVSVFIGVLFSLGSSSFISNLIAGYSMTYRRAFKKGDRIMVGDQTGFVEEQEILVTRMRTVKNEEIVIPNSVLLNSNITNYSTKARENKLIIHTTVGIGYETPWRLVDAMLKKAADRTEGLLKDPPPFVSEACPW